MPAEWKTLILFTAGTVGGIMNSIAGGGSLITFPALLWAGLPSIQANATNTWSVMGGIGTSLWSYKGELKAQRKWVMRYLGPSLLGGLVGSLLLVGHNPGLEDLVLMLVPDERGGLRDSVVIHTGEIDQLKRFKDDVREVKAGFECGISLKSFQELKEGDQFEVFEILEVARTL